MALNLTPVFQHPQRFLFSVNSKAYTNPHFCLFHSYYYHPLQLKKPLLPLSPSPSSSSLWPFHVTRVSTAPVEYAPPAPDFDFHQEIARLKGLRSKLSNSMSLEEKLAVVDGDARVKQFFDLNKKGVFYRVLETLHLDSRDLYLVKCLVAAGQEHVLCFGFGPVESESELSQGSLKSAFHVLAEMIDKLGVEDVSGNGGERLGKKNDLALKDKDEMSELKRLLKTLEEIESFYDCIGGIIG